VDEITLFAELKPPTTDAAEAHARVRARLDAALTGAAPAASRRRGHRRAAMLVAAGAVACAAVVVPVTLPGGGAATPLVSKAWAVERNPDGTITVTIAQVAYDAAGLERALQAEGVATVVRFSQVSDPGFEPANPLAVPGLCVPPAAALEPLSVLDAVVTPRTVPAGQYQRHEFVIHPSAMPPGSAIYISDVRILGTRFPGQAAAFAIRLLKQDRMPPC
jgi:hypothetical protein